MQVIKKHTNSHHKYSRKLLDEGVINEEDLRNIHNKIQSILQEEFDAGKDFVPKDTDWLSSVWSGFMSPAQLSRIRNTGVSLGMLQSVGNTITTIPEGFNAHRQIKKVYEQRRAMVADSEGMVDWGMAEALAFGTLVAEGNHVRLSGQVRSPC